MKPLSALDGVAFSELLDLCRAEPPRRPWPPNGSFVKQTRNGNGSYWYYKGYEKAAEGSGRQTLTYLGKAGDPEVEAVVAAHGRTSAAYRNRRQLASRLRRAGLPSPHPIEGAMAAALAATGLFAAGAVLVGSVAYQTYGGLLGVRLDQQWYRTQDLDVAQARGLKIKAGTVPPVDLLGELRKIDASFAPIHHGDEPDLVAGFRNDADFRIEFLTPQRATRGRSSRFSEVAGLPGVGAQTLRFLEYVLENPVHSVLLHDAGIVVPVPEPTRYAVHKLIVAVSRAAPTIAPQNRAKALKDVLQAESIIEGCEHARWLPDLGRAWIEAFAMGPSWRKTLREGTLRLSPDPLALLARSVREAGAMDGVRTPFDLEDDPRRALLSAT